MIELKDLSARRGGFELANVSCRFAEQGLTCIIGENGSGKTTLLRCLAGLIKYSGRALIDGCDIAELAPALRARRISLLPQQLPDSRLTLSEFMKLSRIPYTGVWGRMSEADINAVGSALSALNLEGCKRRRLDTLSGGELRRACIAATLAQDTPYVLLDEPSGNLDPRAAREVRALARRLTDEFGKTVIMVTHDLTDAAEAADHILIMDSGRLAFSGTRDECLESRQIERVFGVAKYEAGGRTVFL